ncbi:MAG: DsbA family oxidoreductase [Pseudomonadota bacterium]
MISLDIISDPICPWCYIGLAKLRAGLASHDHDPFEVQWRPFQLNPDMPAEGMDRAAYLEAKFGAENAERFYTRIEETAKEAGLDVHFDRIAKTPNTIDAHRLIRWAKSTGNQTAVKTQLFIRYFERGEDISDHDVLLDVAETTGMERPIVERLLAGDADVEAVRQEDTAARQMGVTGVPTFIIAGKYVLQGAQEAETWSRVVEELAAVPT